MSKQNTIPKWNETSFMKNSFHYSYHLFSFMFSLSNNGKMSTWNSFLVITDHTLSSLVIECVFIEHLLCSRHWGVDSRGTDINNAYVYMCVHMYIWLHRDYSQSILCIVQIMKLRSRKVCFSKVIQPWNLSG